MHLALVNYIFHFVTNIKRFLGFYINVLQQSYGYSFWMHIYKYNYSFIIYSWKVMKKDYFTSRKSEVFCSASFLMLLPFLLLILGIAFFNIFVISARLNARAWLFYSSFVVAKLRVLKDFVFYDLSFSFWRTKKYNGILLNGWSIKMWKIAKSTFCDKKHSNTPKQSGTHSFWRMFVSG